MDKKRHLIQRLTSARLLFQCVKKFKAWLIVSVILGFVSALISGISMTMTAPVLLELLGQHLSFHTGPGILGRIIGVLNAFPETHRFLWLNAFLIALAGAKSLVSFISATSFLHLTRLCTQDLRERVISTLMQASFGYFSTMKTGQFVSLVSREVDQAAKVLVVSSQLFSLSITVAVYVLIMLGLAPKLCVVSIVLFGLALRLNLFIIREANQLGRQRVAQASKLSAALHELFGGMKLVKVNATENREQSKILAISTESAYNDYRAGAGSSAIAPLTELTGMAIIVFVISFGRILIPADGEKFSAILLTLLFLLFRTLAQINSINGKRTELAGLLPSVEILTSFLDQRDTFSPPNGTVQYSPLQQGIRFENVSFKYNADSELIVRNISFFIPKGSVLAIVGESGGGKSTIADLICRFYDPDHGEIFLDGRDVKDFDLRTLRPNIGLVSQDTFLFNDTIENNIRYSRPEASTDDVRKAAEAAHALEFIEKMPLGFASPVGERGNQLSFGERQRICIARVLLTNPDILVFDEATSALDSLSESIVQKTLDELMRTRTSLVIAHRLSTVQKANQIAVLNNGQIAELGTHDELLAKNGLYKQMCQVGGIIV